MNICLLVVMCYVVPMLVVVWILYQKNLAADKKFEQRIKEIFKRDTFS